MRAPRQHPLCQLSPPHRPGPPFQRSSRKRAILPAATLAVVLILLVSPAPPRADEGRTLPPLMDRPVISAAKFEQISEGELLLTGDVDLRYGELRMLADTVRYNDVTHMVGAEGNVVIMFGRSQISGDRLEMNIETKLATIWNAHGYMDPDVIFRAEKLERVAEDKVVITSGTVTTCTQPTPYWSFYVSKATLHMDHYAYMRNVSFRASKAPVIYLPYMLWPLKRERASGLLLPNVGYSKQRGSFIGNAFYLVMGRSQDATFFLDKYGQTGTGLGFEYRFVPARRGHGQLTGYYLEDTVADPDLPSGGRRRTRYRFKYEQTQRFAHGYRLLADLNAVSDLDYYLDFERDITQTTSPTVFSHVDVIRNWDNFAFNVRADRQEQFISLTEELTLQRLPELELRGRGIRFGRSPFYLSFETSAGVFNKARTFDDPNTGVFTRETTYERLDLFPTISASFTPTPWLDISPSVSARETYYSRSLVDPNNVASTTSDKDITRDFARFDLSVVGPRFFRLFGDPKDTSGTVYKHTFEPRLSYSFIPEVNGGDNVIRFDEVDTLRGDVNQITYSLTSRLFAKRPAQQAGASQAIPEEPYASQITGPTQVQAPAADLKDLPSEIKEAIKDTARAPGVGSVEVATFDLSQSYSLDRKTLLSNATPLEPTGLPAETLDSNAGPLIATIRYNPYASASLDLRATYDVLFDDISSVSMSANLRSLEHGYARLSWFLNRDFVGRFVDPNGAAADPSDPNTNGERRFLDASQVRLIGGTSFLKRKITLDLEGSYDIENQDLRDQRYRLGYNTQCCGVLVEVARRDFQTIDEIQYRFVLNLRGVGTFLDLQGRPR